MDWNLILRRVATVICFIAILFIAWRVPNNTQRINELEDRVEQLEEQPKPVETTTTTTTNVVSAYPCAGGMTGEAEARRNGCLANPK